MKPLITITLEDYNKLKSEVHYNTEKQRHVQTALYLAYRIMEGTDCMTEFNKAVKVRNYSVTRVGATINVEKLPFLPTENSEDK